MRKRIRRNKRAFTLMEVLLVAGILALLAALALPQLMKRSDLAKIELAKTWVGFNGPIGKALDDYRFDMGRYLDTDEGLAALFTEASGEDEERWKGPYLRSTSTVDELKDPWGSLFEYKSPGEFHEDGYDLWSRGKDQIDDGGKEGSDDIKNWVET